MTIKKLKTLVCLPVLMMLALTLLWACATDDTLTDPSDEEGVNQEEGTNHHAGVPILHEGNFELPIEGAAGYASVELPLHLHPEGESPVQLKLPAGTPFNILNEDGNWWEVQTNTATGWVEHKYAMINLPDVLPSIIYDNTNSYSSLFRSSSQEIPGLTGEALYDAIDYNDRLEQEAFMMPVLYATAKKISVAQKLALTNGEGLKIYETYRPFDVQVLVGELLGELAENNEEVEEGLSREPWNLSWFIIINGVSNHQRGAAVDMSLVEVETMEHKVIGDYITLNVSEYVEYDMQTPMHELSVDSVIYTSPFSSSSQTAWLEHDLVDEMTEGSIRLQGYATEAGLTPIASEWWHFNDLDAVEDLGEDAGVGDFHLTETLNSQPTLD